MFKETYAIIYATVWYGRNLFFILNTVFKNNFQYITMILPVFAQHWLQYHANQHCAGLFRCDLISFFFRLYMWFTVREVSGMSSVDKSMNDDADSPSFAWQYFDVTCIIRYDTTTMPKLFGQWCQITTILKWGSGIEMPKPVAADFRATNFAGQCLYPGRHSSNGQRARRITPRKHVHRLN